MKKHFFTGVIRPERAVLSIGNIMHGLELADGNRCTIKFNAYNNQITAVVETDEKEDIYTLRNLVRSNVELITDVIGFIRGYAYDVEIIKAFSEDLEMSQVFGIDIPALAERNKAIPPEAVNHVYPLCLDTQGIFLRRALGDLGMAIRHSDDTAFYCFRAIESLKQYFGFMSGKINDKEQWEEMAKAVGDHRNTVEPIRKLAFPARHGVPDPVTDEERKNIFLSTWTIVEAYVNYRLKESGSNFRFQPTQKE